MFTSIVRIVLGLVLFVFGLDAFVHFLPQPDAAPPADALAFFGAMVKTGYLFQLVKGTEVVVGAMLALALIAPVIVNIVAFNAFLAPSGLPIALAVLAAELFLAWRYRAAYRPLFAVRAA